MNKFTCSICNQEYPIEEKVKSKGVNRCKPCHNLRLKELRKEKKEVKQGAPIPIQKKKEEKDEKQKSAKAKKFEIKELKEITSGLLMSGFALISTKAGEEWMITKDEADSISSPLINILNKYKLFENINKNMDSIALIIATGNILIPRGFVTYEKMREKKKSKGATIHEFRTKKEKDAGNNTGTNTTRTQGNTNIPTPDSKDDFGPTFTV